MTTTMDAAGQAQRLESSGEERSLLRQGVPVPIEIRAEQGRVLVRWGDAESLSSADMALSRADAMGLAARLVAAVKAAGG